VWKCARHAAASMKTVNRGLDAPHEARRDQAAAIIGNQHAVTAFQGRRHAIEQPPPERRRLGQHRQRARGAFLDAHDGGQQLALALELLLHALDCAHLRCQRLDLPVDGAEVSAGAVAGVEQGDQAKDDGGCQGAHGRPLSAGDAAGTPCVGNEVQRPRASPRGDRDRQLAHPAWHLRVALESQEQASGRRRVGRRRHRGTERRKGGADILRLTRQPNGVTRPPAEHRETLTDLARDFFVAGTRQ